MKTKFTAVMTSNQLKLAIATVAITFLVVDAIQSKSIGSFAWAMLVVYWSLPESKTAEEKK